MWFNKVLKFIIGYLKDFIKGGFKAAFLETLSSSIIRNRKVINNRETRINKLID
jgi:hypothetical protein